MNQSIESIWKKSFINNDELVIPKVNDLYNKKSENLIDKFHSLFDLNRKFIIGVAFLSLLVLSAIGAPILGVFVAVWLYSLLIVGKNGMKKLHAIDKNTSSYHYLKSFVSWKEEVVAVYSKTYTIYYPILLLAIAIQVRFTNDAEAIIQSIVIDSPDMTLIFATPWFFVVGIAITASLLSYFASALYRMDLNIMYGESFKKLNSLIADMESLR
jgi:hypothetical protein